MTATQRIEEQFTILHNCIKTNNFVCETLVRGRIEGTAFTAYDLGAISARDYLDILHRLDTIST